MADQPNLMSRRTALAAGAAALATPLLAVPSFAAPPRVASGMKIVSILSRKDGMTHEAFVRHWIDVHGTMARKVKGVGGFIGSEPIGPAAAPGALFGEIDGIASIWFADRQASAASVSSPEGKLWLADGDTFISRPRSRNFVTREHIVVPGRRIDGGAKRTMLIVRRPDLTHAQFMAHWLGIHADLARAVPGIAGCVFTEITGTAGGPEGAAPEIDGISESWWAGPGTENGGKIASPQADAWAKDGDNFLDNARSRLFISREHVVIAPPAA